MRPTTAEEFADAIAALYDPSDPVGVCNERDGKCSRVPCCKDKDGEKTQPGW